MCSKTKKVLNSLRLRSTFTGVFARANAGLFQKLLKVQPYVTFGYGNPHPLPIFPCFSSEQDCRPFLHYLC